VTSVIEILSSSYYIFASTDNVGSFSESNISDCHFSMIVRLVVRCISFNMDSVVRKCVENIIHNSVTGGADSIIDEEEMLGRSDCPPGMIDISEEGVPSDCYDADIGSDSTASGVFDLDVVSNNEEASGSNVVARPIRDEDADAIDSILSIFVNRITPLLKDRISVLLRGLDLRNEDKFSALAIIKPTLNYEILDVFESLGFHSEIKKVVEGACLVDTDGAVMKLNYKEKSYLISSIFSKIDDYKDRVIDDTLSDLFPKLLLKSQKIVESESQKVIDLNHPAPSSDMVFGDNSSVKINPDLTGGEGSTSKGKGKGKGKGGNKGKGKATKLVRVGDVLGKDSMVGSRDTILRRSRKID
ncbi:hypothetical protein, partial [Candidatus Ichthyocystis sparus]|uniref:hypothetical protein n=1 Tax=Candidatus Ichthyocystis sparus TaxID=1561004 RepID=UPI001F5ECF75